MTIGYLFPGQGSQSIGMLSGFQELGNDIQEHLAEASELIGVDLPAIVNRGPEELLNKTEVTQPVILATSIGLYSMTRRFGLETPSVVAGHSLGEYSALVASGVLEFATAVQLVHARGRIMQSAVPIGTGAMVVVVGLNDEQVLQACDAVDGTVEIANYNSPGQVVIAGTSSAVSQVSEACKDIGARRTIPIDMSVPSHCSLLQSASKQLSEVLAPIKFKQPRMAVFQNVNAKITTDHRYFKPNLVTQLSSSVMWHQSIDAMIDYGVTTFVECGPGRVLTGILRRINRDVNAIALSQTTTFEKLLREQ